MFNELNWKRLKKPLIIASTCIVLSVFSIGGALYFKSEAKSHLHRVNVQLEQSNYRTQQARRSRSILAEYKARYDVLKINGIVGKEDRLSWVENFRKVAERFLLPIARIDIDKRQEVDVSQFAMGTSGISLYESKMRLDLELLHEADLLNLIHNMRKHSRGLFTVEQCDVKSVKEGVKLSHLRNMLGACMLSWYTIEEQGVSI
ncbi:MAG: hypothetical protein KUG82_12645 [Pseudomonadales bacterium]|nr:hypothetical protein [Pseudomonadales bacterium]